MRFRHSRVKEYLGVGSVHSAAQTPVKTCSDGGFANFMESLSGFWPAAEPATHTADQRRQEKKKPVVLTVEVQGDSDYHAEYKVNPLISRIYN
jgi:hypothetical protein